MNLIYVADPMCSWCYGFSKELSALTGKFPHLPVQIVVGGVRAGATDVLDEAGKRFRLQHWTRVANISGLPFNREAFHARENFVYDTEPVCRAVVTARTLAPAADLLAVFRALQHAFYADALDTTDGSVLAGIASAALAGLGYSVDAGTFHEAWSTPAMIAETRKDFMQARSWGVNSFPALFLAKDGKLHSVTAGYTGIEALERQVNATLGTGRSAGVVDLASA